MRTSATTSYASRSVTRPRRLRYISPVEPPFIDIAKEARILPKKRVWNGNFDNLDSELCGAQLGQNYDSMWGRSTSSPPPALPRPSPPLFVELGAVEKHLPRSREVTVQGSALQLIGDGVDAHQPEVSGRFTRHVVELSEV
jgi:hypothetical protein